MLAKLDRFFSYELTVAELIGTLILIGIPYGLIGLIWSLTHTSHLHTMHGADVAVSFLGSIVCWPVLLFANVCMA